MTCSARFRLHADHLGVRSGNPCVGMASLQDRSCSVFLRGRKHECALGVFVASTSSCVKTTPRRSCSNCRPTSPERARSPSDCIPRAKMFLQRRDQPISSDGCGFVPACFRGCRWGRDRRSPAAWRRSRCAFAGSGARGFNWQINIALVPWRREVAVAALEPSTP